MTKYGFDLNKETLEAIVFLLAHDYAHAGIDEDGLSVYLHLNDIFHYATSDCEEIPLYEIKLLVEEVLKHHDPTLLPNPGWYPILIWAQKKRGIEFIPEVKKEVEEFLKAIIKLNEAI